MNSKSIVLVVIALVCIGLFNAAEGGEKKRKSKEEIAGMTCKQIVSYITKEAMQALATCTKKLGFKSQKERKEKMFCIMKCVGIEEGMLEPDGSVSKARIEKFIEDHVPEKFHDKIYPFLNECVFNQKIEIDPKDEFCKSYEPLLKCIMEKAGDVATICERNGA